VSLANDHVKIHFSLIITSRLYLGRNPSSLGSQRGHHTYTSCSCNSSSWFSLSAVPGRGTDSGLRNHLVHYEAEEEEEEASQALASQQV